MSGFYDSKRRNVNALPASRKTIGTRFLLYTRRNPTVPDTFLWNSEPDSLRDTHFDPERLTKFYIHGFMQVGKFPDYPIVRMNDELLKVGDFNVFAVDWSKASLYDYIQASANTRIVGLEVASLIEKLRLAFGVAPESMHVYGHSLGSHIGGYAGEKLQGRLGRITGLDPAEPFFQGMPTHVRLDEGDALYVDAVHTDGSRFAMSFEGLGMIDPVGKVDIYPNGGARQPGCDSDIRTISFKHGAWQGIRETVACKHERAIQLMTASLELETNPDPDLCRLVGFACPSFEEFLRGSCSECGEDGSQCAVLGTATVPSGNPAKFYLKTTDTAPYCLYHYNIRVILATLARTMNGRIFLDVKGEEGHATLNLSLSEEEYKSDDQMTYLTTTREKIGSPVACSLSFTSSSSHSQTLSVLRVEVFLMNVLKNVRSKKAATVSFCPNSTEQEPVGRTIPLSLCKPTDDVKWMR
ncbi:pancreatic lipase-related protein 2-like [Ixodes scapularis]|uniref:pancreatic lipase-related protein 2-like n=1 Tax=Ixodes scapularis TaxID=6945 RepID=UPI001C3868C7|nr:pancreatic lipase-related protein 2-like [Ixodes scapularis]